MAGQPYPGPVERHLVRARQRLQHGGEGRRRQARLELHPQPLQPDSGEIGIVLVEGLERREQRALEPQPCGRREAERRARDADDDAVRCHHVDRGAERAIARERREVQVPGSAVEQGGERGLRVFDRERLELRETLGRAAPARRRTQIEEEAARDGALRRGVAQHEAVMRGRGDRTLEHELDKASVPGATGVAEQHDTGRDIARGVMQPHRHPLRDRLALRGEHAQTRVDAVGRRVQGRIKHDVAARDRVLADAVAGEIERATFARRAALGRAVLRMNRAYARRNSRGADGDVVADMDRAREHGSGDDRAGAGERERAIDREAEPAVADCAIARARANSVSRSRSMPSPVTTETGRMSAPARPVPVSVLAISVSTCARRSGEARSDFVSATMPCRMPSRSTIARCSRVCGMTPSSAATTSSTKSMPVAPASMLCTNFSCPGTSTKPSVAPSGAGR